MGEGGEKVAVETAAEQINCLLTNTNMVILGSTDLTQVFAGFQY